MSAIGDYIHLTARGYMNPSLYGITSNSVKKDGTPYDLSKFKNLGICIHDAKAAYNAKAAVYKNYFHGGDRIDSLVRKLQIEANNALAFLYGSDQSATNEDQDNSDISETIYQEIINNFTEGFEGVILQKDLNTLNLSTGANRLIGSKGSVESRVTRIQKILDRLTKNISKIIGEPNNTTIVNIQKNIEDYQTSLKAFQAEIENLKSSIDPSANKAAITREINKALRSNENFGKLVNDVNQLIQQARSLNKTQKERAGEVGEAFAKTIAQRLENEIDNEITGVTQSGNKRHTVGYKASSFMTTDFLQQSKKYTIGDEIFVTETFGSSKDLADIEFTIKGEDTPVGISVKNYATEGLIHGKNQALSITHGSPFLTFLQDENDKDFVNHYLNLCTRAPKEEHALGQYSDLMFDYNNLIKRIVLYKSLTRKNMTSLNQAKTGLNYNNVNTQIFQLLLRTRGGMPQVKFISIKDLMESSGLIDAALVSGIPKIIMRTSFNEPMQRIESLLTQLHAAKIAVALNTNTIKMFWKEAPFDWT